MPPPCPAGRPLGRRIGDARIVPARGRTVSKPGPGRRTAPVSDLRPPRGRRNGPTAILFGGRAPGIRGVVRREEVRTTQAVEASGRRMKPRQSIHETAFTAPCNRLQVQRARYPIRHPPRQRLRLDCLNRAMLHLHNSFRAHCCHAAMTCRGWCFFDASSAAFATLCGRLCIALAIPCGRRHLTGDRPPASRTPP